MKKWKSYRYLVFLCIGGMIFFVIMGYPEKIREKVLPTLRYVQKEERLSLDLLAEVMAKENQKQENAEDQTDSKEDLTEQNTEENTESSESEGEAEVAEEEPLPEEKVRYFGNADEHYFDDAAFIGDSRVVGLYEYGGLDNATFYCASGMSLRGVFGPPNRRFKDGNWKENIADSLQQNTFGKIYIMLGINDMGTGDLNYFTTCYQDMISQIRMWQPDAIIFIQSIMAVTEERSGQGDYINNEGIQARNEILKTMDNGTDIFYLDVNSVVCDEKGYLKAEYTSDGVHLYAKYIYLWTDYLKSHAAIEK